MVGEQEDRLARHAKEVAHQAKVAGERFQAVAQGAAQSAAHLGSVAVPAPAGDVKSMAQAFSVDGRAAQTLNALMAQGSQQAGAAEGYAFGTAAIDKICISRLSKGVTDASIRLECARHGAVTSVILQGDGSAAYVTYATADMAANAMRRILGRSGAMD